MIFSMLHSLETNKRVHDFFVCHWVTAMTQFLFNLLVSCFCVLFSFFLALFRIHILNKLRIIKTNPLDKYEITVGSMLLLCRCFEWTEMKSKTIHRWLSIGWWIEYMAETAWPILGLPAAMLSLSLYVCLSALLLTCAAITGANNIATPWLSYAM